MPITPVTTFVLGILVKLTFGLLLLPFDLIWIILFWGPLHVSSFICQKFPLLTPLFSVLCIPLAVVGYIYNALLPAMGEMERRANRFLICDTWPYTWQFYKYMCGKLQLMPRVCAFSSWRHYQYKEAMKGWRPSELGEDMELTKHVKGISELFLILRRNIRHPAFAKAVRAIEETRIEFYKDNTRKNPNDANVYFELGVACVAVGRYEEAVGAYKQAVMLKPDFSENHSSLGVSYENLGRQQEAMAAYKEAVRINPNFAEAHHSLGHAYLGIRDSASAVKECKILETLDVQLAGQLWHSIEIDIRYFTKRTDR